MKKTSSFTTLVLLSLAQDRKSTRLNSSHVRISYAVFCLKKKKQQKRSSKPTQAPAHCRHKPKNAKLCPTPVRLCTPITHNGRITPVSPSTPCRLNAMSAD